MIDYGVLSTYELDTGFRGYKFNIEGYGMIDDINGIEIGHGCLVSLSFKNSFFTSYVFIADKPVLDTRPITEDQYLFHKGAFKDERAEGRCWFVNVIKEVDGIIYTTYGGMFHKKHVVKGVVV